MVGIKTKEDLWDGRTSRDKVNENLKNSSVEDLGIAANTKQMRLLDEGFVRAARIMEGRSLLKLSEDTKSKFNTVLESMTDAEKETVEYLIGMMFYVNGWNKKGNDQIIDLVERIANGEDIFEIYGNYNDQLPVKYRKTCSEKIENLKNQATQEISAGKDEILEAKITPTEEPTPEEVVNVEEVRSYNDVKTELELLDGDHLNISTREIEGEGCYLGVDEEKNCLVKTEIDADGQIYIKNIYINDVQFDDMNQLIEFGKLLHKIEESYATVYWTGIIPKNLEYVVTEPTGFEEFLGHFSGALKIFNDPNAREMWAVESGEDGSLFIKFAGNPASGGKPIHLIINQETVKALGVEAVGLIFNQLVEKIEDPDNNYSNGGKNKKSQMLESIEKSRNLLLKSDITAQAQQEQKKDKPTPDEKVGDVARTAEPATETPKTVVENEQIQKVNNAMDIIEQSIQEGKVLFIFVNGELRVNDGENFYTLTEEDARLISSDSVLYERWENIKKSGNQNIKSFDGIVERNRIVPTKEEEIAQTTTAKRGVTTIRLEDRQQMRNVLNRTSDILINDPEKVKISFEEGEIVIKFGDYETFIFGEIASNLIKNDPAYINFKNRVFNSDKVRGKEAQWEENFANFENKTAVGTSDVIETVETTTRSKTLPITDIIEGVTLKIGLQSATYKPEENIIQAMGEDGNVYVINMVEDKSGGFESSTVVWNYFNDLSYENNINRSSADEIMKAIMENQ